MIHVTLDLRRHCIETEIRRVFNRLISDYFKRKRPDEDLEDRLELLQNAMRTFDFCHLRATWKDLRGNSKAQIRLEGDGRNTPVLSINGRPVDDCRGYKEENGRGTEK